VIVLGSWVWEGTSLDVKPGEAEGARNEHIFKELDTGDSYTRINGEWEFMDTGLSFIKATKSGLITTDAAGLYHVTFVTPFINIEYSVALSVQFQSFGSKFGCIAYKKNIAADGFDIITLDTRNGAAYGGVTVSWLATRHYNP